MPSARAQATAAVICFLLYVAFMVSLDK